MKFYLPTTSALSMASLDQLAAVLGTELETDEAGQVTLNLGALY